MEQQLNYFPIISLEQMALRRIAVDLWNDSDTLVSMGKYQAKYFERETLKRNVANLAADKVPKLQLPESLQKQMIPILRIVGLEILKWKWFHQEHISDSRQLGLPILEKICWTSRAAVDYSKAAEELVRSDVLDIVKRYKLACLYCFEKHILELWKELPEEVKVSFYNETTPKTAEPALHYCWPYILKGEEFKLDYMHKIDRTSHSIPRMCEFGGSVPIIVSRARFHQYAFEYSSVTGKKSAAKYFLQKLTHEEREASLVQTANEIIKIRNNYIRDCFQSSRERLSNVLCYLLSVMTHEEQILIFKTLKSDVLSCFLDWPWQDLFMDIADVMWPFLSLMDYNYLLLKMESRMEESGFYFANLFQNCFLRSPINFRKHFVGKECFSGSFFREFFHEQHSETIKVIFRNLDAADRVRLVSSGHALRLFYKYISKDKWPMVEVCLREAKLSKEDKQRLKVDFMEFRNDTDWGNLNWRRFFEFLDETDAIEARMLRH